MYVGKLIFSQLMDHLLICTQNCPRFYTDCAPPGKPDFVLSSGFFAAFGFRCRYFFGLDKSTCQFQRHLCKKRVESPVFCVKFFAGNPTQDGFDPFWSAICLPNACNSFILFWDYCLQVKAYRMQNLCDRRVRYYQPATSALSQWTQAQCEVES